MVERNVRFVSHFILLVYPLLHDHPGPLGKPHMPSICITFSHFSKRMSELTIEEAHGPMDSFLLNSWFGFQGPFPKGALIIVFICEFTRLHVPAIFQGISFILTLIPIPRFWKEDYRIEGASSSDLSQDPVIIPDKYSTFHDDRKAKKGGENDVFMLKTHGFNKYRHLSEPFIKRNMRPSEPRFLSGPKEVAKEKRKSKGKKRGKK